MELWVSGEPGQDKLSEDDIREAVMELDVNDAEGHAEGFVILFRTDSDFMQCAGDATSGFVLEYQEGGIDRHFRTTREDWDAATIILKMTQYARGDESWKQGVEWESLENWNSRPRHKPTRSRPQDEDPESGKGKTGESDPAAGTDLEERVRESLLRAVMWGEEKDVVMSRLKANGITGAKADGLYRVALAERISTIRSAYMKWVFVGILLMGLAVGVVAAFVAASGGGLVISRLLILPAVIAALGICVFAHGLLGVVSARAKTGPVSDIE